MSQIKKFQIPENEVIKYHDDLRELSKTEKDVLEKTIYFLESKKGGSKEDQHRNSLEIINLRRRLLQVQQEILAEQNWADMIRERLEMEKKAVSQGKILKKPRY